MQSLEGNDPLDTDPELNSDELTLLQQVLVLSKTGMLLRKDTLSIRAFLLSDESTICAYVLSELEDSFVVLFPSRVGASGSDVACDPISKIPMVRIFKHEIRMVTMPPNKFLYFYLIGTKDRRSEVPGYFTAGRTQQADAMIEVIYNVEKGLPPLEGITVATKSEILAVRGSRSRAGSSSSSQNDDEDDDKPHYSDPVKTPTKRYRH